MGPVEHRLGRKLTERNTKGPITGDGRPREGEVRTEKTIGQNNGQSFPKSNSSDIQEAQLATSRRNTAKGALQKILEAAGKEVILKAAREKENIIMEQR